MTPSSRCTDYIKSIETLVSPARHLAVDSNKPNVITGGYGETSPALVHYGMVVSEALAEQWLNARMMAIAASVEHLLGPVPVTQGQFDALVSFSYNEGIHRLSASSILSWLQIGNVMKAADAFLLYDLAGGVKEEGLDIRRRLERFWFLDGVS